MTPIQRTVLTHFLNAATIVTAIAMVYCTATQDWNRLFVLSLALVATLCAKVKYIRWGKKEDSQ